MTYAKLLTIQFRATSSAAWRPIPTHERGARRLGYTMSLLGGRARRVIRTQVSPAFAKKNLREPAERMGSRSG